MKVRELFQDRVLTVSNILTLMRIAAAPVLGYFIYREHRTGDPGYIWCEMGAVVVIIMTDLLDRNLARMMNQVSKLGQYLDPLADKIAGLCAMLFLVLCKGFPLRVLTVALAREILAVIAAAFPYHGDDIHARPNVFGKLSALSLALCGSIHIMSLDCSWQGISLKHFSIILVLLFYLPGGLLYITTYARQYFGNKA